jgi:hypothetical protein
VRLRVKPAPHVGGVAEIDHLRQRFPRWSVSTGLATDAIHASSATRGSGKIPTFAAASARLQPAVPDYLRLLSAEITESGPKRRLGTEALTRAEPEVRIHSPPAARLSANLTSSIIAS